MNTRNAFLGFVAGMVLILVGLSITGNLDNQSDAPPATAISEQCVSNLEELSNEIHFEEQAELAEQSGSLPESDASLPPESTPTAPVKEAIDSCLNASSASP